MHRRKMTKALLILISLVVFLGGGSTVHVTQGDEVEDADTRSAPRSLGTSLATAEGAMEWRRTYNMVAYAVIQTADGGFVLVGLTESDYSCLVKIDAHGTMEWQQTYGSSDGSYAYAGIQVAGGGFALAGFSVAGSSEADAWLMMTDAHGNMAWQQTYWYVGYGGTLAWTVIQTTDGGFALAGVTAPGVAGSRDGWLVKTDAHGTMEWQRTYGGRDWDQAEAIIQTADGGFAFAGYTASYGAGNEDFWLVKTDAHGTMEWQQTYGGSHQDEAYAVIETPDGGFALAGYTYSYGAGEADFWLVKTDARGEPQWMRTYGSFEWEVAYAGIQTMDGGFALAGTKATDAWLIKTDAYGSVEWVQTYGGPGYERTWSVIQTADGGFMLAGSGWLVKTISLDAPTVTVASPNGGESWSGAHTLMWTATDPQADPLTYTVYYSPNGEQTWTQLATKLTEPSYRWDTTTVVDGTNYLIKVEATDGTYTGMDISDAPFEIVNEPTNNAPTVRVIRPNGGERIRGTFEIQWSANDPEGDALTFTISYSSNEGQTWTQLANEVTETSYLWDTAGVRVGTTYLIKVEASDRISRVEDSSDAPFTVEREALTETSSETPPLPELPGIRTLVLLSFVALIILRVRKKP